ncbi:MAG TPA: hypothetical protein VJ810_35950 [Blastocatellia bacterium]|nr:hypothetical protein [Blastocatellia bacterium]
MRVIKVVTIVLFVFLQVNQFGYAQHCAPIVESYLSEISVKHVDESIAVRVEYTKNGGQPKAKYQAYLLAYLEKNRVEVPAAPPKPVINQDVVVILHTQLIERNQTGRYDMEVSLNIDELAKKMIKHGQLAEKDQTNYGGWGQYNDKIRIAVFIPFLEDQQYSNLKALPEDKHECNYSHEQALLFQELPYSFSMRFGIVQAVKLKEGRFHIEINGDKPKKTNSR